jgi:hypothetical protein
VRLDWSENQESAARAIPNRFRCLLRMHQTENAPIAQNPGIRVTFSNLVNFELMLHPGGLM